MADYLPPVVIEFTADGSDVLSTIEEIKAALAAFSRDGTGVDLTADMKQLEKSLTAADTMLNAWKDKPVAKKVVLDLGLLRGSIDEVNSLIREKVSDAYVDVIAQSDVPPVVAKVSADTTEYDKTMASIFAKLQAFNESEWTTKLFADPAGVVEGIATAVAALNNFKRRKATSSLGVDLKQLQADLQTAVSEVGAFEDAQFTTTLAGDPAAVKDAVSTARTTLNNFQKQVWTAKIDADLTRFYEKMVEAANILEGFKEEQFTTSPDVNLSRLLGRMVESDLLLEEYQSKVWVTQLDASLNLLLKRLVEADLLLEAYADKTWTTNLNVTVRGAQKIAGLKALLNTLPRSRTVSVNVNSNAAKAIAAAGASSVVADAAAASGGGGGGGGGLTGLGLAEMFGWRNGRIAPGGGLGLVGMLPQMAAAGSIGSLAGFGVEHVVMTGVGLAGSLAGAAVGGGLLAGGALSLGAVGVGTDLAGIGQALNDTKAYSSALSNLQNLQASGTATAAQLKDALGKVNEALNAIPVAARASVVSLVTTIHQFKSQFDQLTGPAEAVGAQIIQNVVQVGEKFLPTIGKYALINMEIMKKDLQPLFSWLENAGPSGGLGIFIDMEKMFSARLPMAIHAFTQAFELFAKTMDYAAGRTGGFLIHLDHFVTRMNGADFGRWMDGVKKLIDLFFTWDAFFVILAKDIFLLFGLTAGLAGGPTGIIVTLTGYLTQLHNNLVNMGKGSNLGQLFSLHKQEVLDILNIVIQIGIQIGKAYITIAPAILTGTVVLLNALLEVLKLIEKIPGGVGSAIIGFGILAQRMGLLSPLLMGAQKEANILARIIGAIGFAGLAGNATGEKGDRIGLLAKALGATPEGEENTRVIGAIGSAMTSLKGVVAATATSFTELSWSMKLVTTAGVIVIALVVYELIKHFGVLRGLIIAGAGAVLVLAAAMWVFNDVPVVLALSLIVVALAGVVAAVVWTATHFGEVTAFIKAHALEIGIALIFIMGPLGLLIDAGYEFYTHWKTIWGYIGPIVKGALHDAEAAWDDMTKWFDIGANLINGINLGMESTVGSVIDKVKHVAHDIEGAFKSVLGIFSPSTVTAEMGKNLNQGLVIGLNGTSQDAVTAAQKVSSQIVAAFGSLDKVGATSQAVGQLSGIFKNLASSFNSLDTAAQKSGNVAKDLTQIGNALKTLAQATPALTGSIKTVNGSFDKLDNGKLKAVSGTLDALGGVFRAFGNTAKKAGDVSAPALRGIETALFGLTVSAPAISSGITSVVTAFSSLDSPTSKLHPDLKALSSDFDDLKGVFGAFGNAAKASSKVSSQAMQQMFGAILTMANDIPAIKAALDDLKGKLDKFGNLQAMQKELNSVAGLFKDLGKVFGDVSSASKSSDGVTTPALQHISDAIKGVADTLSKLPAAVSGAKGVAFSELTGLVNGMLSVLYGSATIGAFRNAGANMMAGLAGGIQSAGVNVATATANAAKNAIAASNAATKTQSPSLVFEQQGKDWMAGLVLGIQGSSRAVQGALTGALPRVGSPPQVGGGAGGGTALHVNATFNISAPGGDAGQIKTALQKDAAHQFAKASLTALRAGSGTVYS